MEKRYAVAQIHTYECCGKVNVMYYILIHVLPMLRNIQNNDLSTLKFKVIQVKPLQKVDQHRKTADTLVNDAKCSPSGRLW